MPDGPLSVSVTYDHLDGDWTPESEQQSPGDHVVDCARARYLRIDWRMRHSSPRYRRMLRALATFDVPDKRGAHSISVEPMASLRALILAAISKPIDPALVRDTRPSS